MLGRTFVINLYEDLENEFARCAGAGVKTRESENFTERFAVVGVGAEEAIFAISNT